MIEDDERGHRAADTGLYRLDGCGNACFVRGGFIISNGVCWSPDGAIMYVTDTPTRTIVTFAYDSVAGSISVPVLHAKVGNG